MSEENKCAGIISRRQFLRLSGATVVTLTLPPAMLKLGKSQRFYAQQVEYPRQLITTMADIESAGIIAFRYPWEHIQASNTLIKLNEPAGGGIGPDQAIVAFNNFCTHQGGTLDGQFHDDVGVAGPCPLHWTTFDLSRYGMVISGHATQGLPQIMLEQDGNNIYAVGVQGLIFGYYDNRVDPAT